MMKNTRLKKAILIAILIFVGIFAFFWIRAMTRMGEFSSLRSRFDGKCEIKHSEIAGIEDLKIFSNGKDSLIALSSYDRLAARKNNNIEGAIYVFDINSVGNASALSKLQTPNGFAPVGIDVFDNKVLGAINNKNGSEIAVFESAANGFNYKNSIKIENASRLNDLAFRDEKSFYVSNESDYKHGSFANFIANFLDLDKSGSIYYYDGQKSRKVADGLSYANSIAISKDKKYLVASATLGREIRFYSIEHDAGLKLLQTVFVGTGIDNLSIDDEGRIFAGAHPRLFTLAKRMWGFADNSPSQVIVIEPRPDFSSGNIDQVYLNDDKAGFGTISVAAKNGNGLYMGSIFDKGLMVCDLPQEWHQSKTHPANRLIDTSRDYQIKKAKKALGVAH